MTTLFSAVLLILLSPAPAPAAIVETIGVGGFPAGTLISSTSGDIAIEEVKPGDRILAFSDEKLVHSFVQDTNSRRTLLLTIVTDRGKLVIARTHKLLTWSGFVEAQKLKEDDGLAYLKNGRRTWAKVKKIKYGRLKQVYNLVTAPPHTYIANGYMVHNEGGEGLPPSATPWLIYGFAALSAAALSGMRRRSRA